MTTFFTGAKETHKTMQEVVDSFSWNSTEEGRDYWKQVAYNLHGIEQAEIEYGLVEGETLLAAFNWDDTPQGWYYWDAVYDKLLYLREEYLEQQEGEEKVREQKSPYKKGSECSDYGLKEGDRFFIDDFDGKSSFSDGDIVTLCRDDGTHCPEFKTKDGKTDYEDLHYLMPIEEENPQTHLVCKWDAEAYNTYTTASNICGNSLTIDSGSATLSEIKEEKSSLQTLLKDFKL